MTNFIEILQFSCSAAVFALYREAKLVCKGNDTLESFLSKVAVKSDLRKKTCKNRTCSNRESLFRKKKNFESFHDTRAGFLSRVTFVSYFRRKTL